jgi:cobalt-zinc-cadmium efflux system outer membrane protein
MTMPFLFHPRFAPALLIFLLGISASAQELRLEQAISLAEQHNRDLKLVAIGMDSAAAAVTSAAAAPNPTLTLQTMNISPAAGIGAGGLRSKTVDSTVRIDQVIERGGKRGLRTTAAVRLQEAARADLKDAHRQLRRDVAAAYYDLLAAQERQSISADAAALAENALAAAEQRHKAGDLAGSDSGRLRIDALRARNDADDAAVGLDEARRALALLLGQDAAGGLLATGPWPVALPVPVSDDAALVDTRPDVQAALARVRAAEASRDLARAGRTRDITVGVQFEHYPASTANPQGSGNSVGVAVQVPLFLRYTMQGELRSAEAALDAAHENLDKVRQTARADVARARAQAEAAARRAARYDSDILPATRKAADDAEFAFAHGALGVMDVLDVRRAWRAAQLDALAARADLAKAVAALEAAASPKSQLMSPQP